MQVEIEVKFLDIKPQLLRAKLTALGAALVSPERLMRRVNFESPMISDKKAWVRVRDEGGVVTMTYKQTNDHTATGTQEINLQVDSFDTAQAFLNAAGLTQKSYQETKRESWKLDSVQIEMDTWPWLPPFVELEGPSESRLQQIARQLGFDWGAHVAGDVTAVYQKHYTFSTHDLYHYPITFGPVPSWLAAK